MAGKTDEMIASRIDSYMAERRNSAKSRKSLAESEDDVQHQIQQPTRPKKRALVRLLEEQFPGYHAVVEMAHKAHRLSSIADQRPNDSMAQMDAVLAHEKVAKFTTPQLKAMDLTSNGEQVHFGFNLNLANVTK